MFSFLLNFVLLNFHQSRMFGFLLHFVSLHFHQSHRFCRQKLQHPYAHSFTFTGSMRDQSFVGGSRVLNLTYFEAKPNSFFLSSSLFSNHTTTIHIHQWSSISITELIQLFIPADSSITHFSGLPAISPTWLTVFLPHGYSTMTTTTKALDWLYLTMTSFPRIIPAFSLALS